ncbi:signal peptidase II [Chloroflexota bacterium]
MQKVDRQPPGGKWLYISFFIIALLIAAADQLTKNWIRSYTGEFPAFEIGFIRIIHVQNTGAAFGIFQDQNFILTIVDFIGIALILAFVFLIVRWYPALSSHFSVISLSLVLGGAIGNLIDRLNLGHVTDFIDVGFWPTFNVADSATVIGTILFALSLFIMTRKEEVKT